MKKYKNIACTDFVHVSIALNLHSYEENYYTRFHKKDVSFVADRDSYLLFMIISQSNFSRNNFILIATLK